MQSRRLEDYTNPSDPTMFLMDRRIEFGNAHNPYAMSHLDLLTLSPPSRRSLSPRRVEGSRRLLGGNRRSNSLERRDYGWDLSGGGGRGERVRSRSPPPPLGLVQKRPHYNEGVSSRDLPSAELRRTYEFVDYVDMIADVNTGLKPEFVDCVDMNANVNTGLNPKYGYQRSAARNIREKDFDGSRLPGTSRHGNSEDDAAQGLFRLPANLVPTSNYGEGGGSLTSFSSSSSAILDIGQFKNEYPDPLLVNKLLVMDSYREKEKPLFYSDLSYPLVPVSKSKDFAGTSSGISMASFHGSHQDGMPLLKEDHPRHSAKLLEPLGFSGYGQRSILDSGREPNVKQKDLAYYQCDTFSPTRAERRGFLNPMSGGRENDDYGYPSDESYIRIGTHERVDYNHKELMRPDVNNPITERVDNTESTYGNISDSSLLDQPSMQKQIVSNYFGSSISTASKGGEYLDIGSARVEFGRRMLIDQDKPHFGGSKDHETSHSRLYYGFGKEAGPASHNERMRMSPELKYEAEMCRVAAKAQEIKVEELGKFESSDRVLKRKYGAGEEMSEQNSRIVMSGKWYNTSRTLDLNDRSEEWTVQDSSVSLSSGSLGYDNNLYQRAGRTVFGTDHHKVSTSEDRLLSHDQLEHLQEHSIKPYKLGGSYSKRHPRPGSLSSYKSYGFNRRHILPKPHNVWIRCQDDNQVDMHQNEVDQSEDWVSSEKSGLLEDSKEFKQLVQKSFLIFSKKLNENPVVRKRYKEQGRAGSLFCIVCGRRVHGHSTVGDTCIHVSQVWAKSTAPGSSKAICVLLGWNSVVSPDVNTWVPEVVPDSKAMAQKEDLILWPPVIIIHNSSVMEEQNIITTEAFENFLRGKGFSGGKFQVCFGKPANHSIVVVKFLGTFSGLQDAERLHKYFVDSKHGRAHYDRAASSSSKGKCSSKSGAGPMQGRNMEQLVLYGYMTIAEDLDKVDSDTKSKCLIKSKKEIQDLANAPVKP